MRYALHFQQIYAVNSVVTDYLISMLFLWNANIAYVYPLTLQLKPQNLLLNKTL